MIFNNLKKIEPDEIFSLNNEFINDPRKNKINGGIGIYLDEKGNNYIHPSIRIAQKYLKNNNFNYLPIRGEINFLEEASKLLLGDEHYISSKTLIASQSTIGGTNGLYIWGLLAKRSKKHPVMIVSNPTWENHIKIFNGLGFKIKSYKHLTKTQQFNIKDLIRIIKKNKNTTILFHGGSTHNPTGVNPNLNEWQIIVELLKKSKNDVLFDFAYMGLGNDINQDCYPIRLFVKNKIPVSVILSFSKNMTLYQHRTGMVFVYSKNKKITESVQSNLENIFRIVNSNPAAYGPMIAKIVFESKELRTMWLKDLKKMSNSIKKRRIFFAKSSRGNFDYVKNQFGLFSLLTINERNIEKLKKENGIYLLPNGRINFGGISNENIFKVSNAINNLFIN